MILFCATNGQPLVFCLSKIFLDPKGRKLIAVGERLCAKPTELPSRMALTLKGSKARELSDPFRVRNACLRVPWASRKPLAHGY
jgi:hypothetical protein